MARYLIWLIALAVLYVVNVGLVAGAFRVHRGRNKLHVPESELRWRVLAAAAGMTVILPAVVLTATAFGSTIAVFAVAAAVLVPAGGLWLAHSLGLDEFTEGASVFLVYAVIPGIVLSLAARGWLPLARWLQL